jgi:Uma2 family endonuclease
MSSLKTQVVEDERDLRGGPSQSEIDEVFNKISKIELISEDGIPLETNWHRIQINLLIDSINFLWRDRTDYFASGNMFIYFNLQQARDRDYRGPDVFVAKDVDGTRDRKYWVIWEEGGRYPDIIVELASPSTINIDLGIKKDLYEKVFKTQEYYCYDPDKEKLLGWQLIKGHYVELKPNKDAWLFSEELGLWLGTWKGEVNRINSLWLRLFIDDKELVPTKEEFETKRAEAEAKRAETEAKRAEAEAKRAETEAKRAQAAEEEVRRLRELLAKQKIKGEER